MLINFVVKQNKIRDMKPIIRCLIVLLSLISQIETSAITRYATRYNNFASLAGNGLCEIKDGVLHVANDRDEVLTLIDTTKLTTATFRYYVRLQNTHSKEGKRYTVTDRHGNKRKVESTEAGIVIRISEHDYWTASFCTKNKNHYDDITDERFMVVSLRHYDGGNLVFESDTNLVQNVNLTGGYNVLCVDATPEALTVSAGEKKLRTVITTPSHPYSKPEAVGCYVGPGADLNIERTVLSYSDEPEQMMDSGWTKEALDLHFAKSKNPYEGYWVYLDRDLEDKWLRLGGRYTIALVETEMGYDIIYIDGAQVKKSLWHTGMLKGRMANTIFPNNFNAHWIDATFQPFDLDVYATFESDVILNIKFPFYQSQLRFSKVLDP
jgi:hypothetical protein